MTDDIAVTEQPKKTRKPRAAAVAEATVQEAVEAITHPPARLTLLQRLSAVQNEVDYVQKEKRQGMRYSIVSHDAVTAKVRPVLVKHGVLYYPIRLDTQQHGNRTQAFMTVRFVSVDDREDFIDVQTFGYGIDDSDKGPGKAMSYAVKYALLKCLGMETGDDPDLEQEVVLKTGEPAAAAAGNGKLTTEQTTAVALNALHTEDADYVEGLTLKMVKCVSKEQLTRLHVETKPRREQIAARSPEVYKRYLDLMKQRASEIDGGAQT